MVNNTNQLDNNLETYQEILKSDRDYQNFIETGNEYLKSYDRLGIEIMEGDLVDVQSDGVHEVYRKEDGQLYFKPYNKESRVSDYFSNDLEKKSKQERLLSDEEVLTFTQTIISQFKFGNTNIEQIELLRETLQLFKKK